MQSVSSSTRPKQNDSANVAYWALWATLAAFGTYFCMYAFRKPFTAAPFDGEFLYGLGYKEWMIAAQVAGYMLSKFIGIKVVSELSPNKRAVALLGLLLFAEMGLVLFAWVPRPWNLLCMFLNGLPLGMVFGLVVGFLEGRRLTEMLAAGLCASFIVADGVTKSVGSFLLAQGVAEESMPYVTGMVFSLPTLVFVWMLTRIPPAGLEDIRERVERTPLNYEQRWGLFRRYAMGITCIVGVYFFLTIIRSIRADFAERIWRDLGVQVVPTTFAVSEIWIAVGVLIVCASTAYWRDNAVAFFNSIRMCIFGLLAMVATLLGEATGVVSPFTFMVLIGFSAYLPYVLIHTTLFERFIAMSRETGTLAFLMYLADAYGYLGYIAVMIGKSALPSDWSALQILRIACWLGSFASLCMLCFANFYFRRFARERVTRLSIGEKSTYESV